MNTRTLGIALVFVAGCAVGGASARFVVPSANAQQAATLSKWEYMCFEEMYVGKAALKANAAGEQGWEMSGVMGDSTASGFCFKRPKL
jgi:hypothetical protein